MQSGAPSIDTATTALPKRDGRHRRRDRNREKALLACRAAFLAGEFRPSVVSIAKACRMSTRTVFVAWGSIDALYRAALDDADARQKMLMLIVREGALTLTRADQTRVVLAAVWGKV